MCARHHYRDTLTGLCQHCEGEGNSPWWTYVLVSCVCIVVFGVVYKVYERIVHWRKTMRKREKTMGEKGEAEDEEEQEEGRFDHAWHLYKEDFKTVFYTWQSNRSAPPCLRFLPQLLPSLQSSVRWHRSTRCKEAASYPRPSIVWCARSTR